MARACHPGHPVATRRSLRFDDFDEMAEHIAAWDVQYEQFSSGSFHATMALTASPSVQILTLDWNRALSNLGAAPVGMRSFAFPTTRRHAFRFRGVAAGPGAVMTGRGGSEFHLLTASAFDFVVASLDLGVIAAHIRARFGCDEEDLGEPRLLAGRGEDAVIAAGRALDALGQAMVAAGPEDIARLEMQAVDIVLSALVPPSSAARATRRQHLARRIEDLLRARLADPPGIGELCVLTGATERTLHLAFRETYGISPAAYLRRLRLNAVRRELLDGSGTPITEAATRFGFFHFGRFAADYRRLFGELPSMTVRRPGN